MTDGATELDILHGTLDVLVLPTLSWGPSHGYGIACGIRERSAVEAAWGHTEPGERAKFYRLTTARQRELRRATARWERYAAGVAGMLAAAAQPT
jgi:DNA-binding PadR family transcriptional regulator